MLPGLEDLGRWLWLIILYKYDWMIMDNFSKEMDGVGYKTNPVWRWYVSEIWKEAEGGVGWGWGGVMTHVKKGHNNEDYRGELLNYIEVNKGK